jgi:acetyl-CoA carboxylase biotin carboxyl carrier protein
MDISYVKRLIKLLSESEVDEIEIEEEGKKVRLVKHRNSQAAPAPVAPPQPLPRPLGETPPPVVVTAEPGLPPPAPAVAYHEIKSPIVGTFYRAPAPEAPPFVQVGAPIDAGTVLCIIEAMKLMNEIESDVAGKIVKILVENGQAVEYDQTLFLVETA